MSLHGEVYQRRLIWRHRVGLGFEWLCRLVTLSALVFLLILLVSILIAAFSPGRGKGLAAVSLSSLSEATSEQGADHSEPLFQVSSVRGGHFESTDRPGKKLKEFSEADVRGGKIFFDHDGRRSSPIFNVVVTDAANPDRPSQTLEEVGPMNMPKDISIPIVGPPKPARPYGWLTWSFLTNGNSNDPLEAGIMVGFWGSVWLIVLTAFMAVPLGVGAAVYLEEYAKPTFLTKFIQLNIANLAGVPSIVYGIVGYTVFARMFGFFDDVQASVSLSIFGMKSIEIPLPFGPVLISAACTLALLSLPIVIITSQEALRSIPGSLRHAAYALGATKWQTIWHQVLPAALPGIMTGIILSLSRAIGEAAPLVVIGATAQLTVAPGKISSISDVVQHPEKLIHAPFDRFTALPIQVYSWVTDSKANFEHVAAAGIVILLATLLTMNSIAIFIRQRYQGKNQW